MGDYCNIAGVVLAGGRSSRMGKNKALLDYQGTPLIEHMLDILTRAGLEKTLISGEVEGYECIPDESPFSGPAEAMKSVIHRFTDYAGFLFVPVDMPLLNADMLRFLMQQKEGGYFINWPLPAFITSPFSQSSAISVKKLLHDYGIYPIDTPDHFLSFMKNANTPQEWQKVAAL